MEPKSRPGYRPGDHICCLYDTDNDMVETALPFLAAGLMMNEKCSIIGDGISTGPLLEALIRSGLEPDRFIETGQLVVGRDMTQCPLSATAVNADPILKPRAVIADAAREGFSGYRCVFYVTDFLCHADSRSLMQREIMLSNLLRNIPAYLLLMYDTRHMAESGVADMMELHPRAIYGNMLYENPAYTPPEELL